MSRQDNKRAKRDHVEKKKEKSKRNKFAGRTFTRGKERKVEDTD